MEFGVQLKTLRNARGWTQDQLAEQAGIPNTYLSLMETGKIVPAGEWARRLRAALGWTAETDDLLTALHFSRHTAAPLAELELAVSGAYDEPLAGPSVN
jgi:transcriptional regulator with XRE-family HTH domain